MSSTAFYCVADDRYFLGAVGMINSLRLHGHQEPIYLLDCGLRPDRRELLAAAVTVVPAPRDAAPHLLKTVAPLEHPAEVMVLIDTDMIVTRPLDELIAAAARGRVIAFENNVDRFFPEWGELLGLGPIERKPYLCSGFVAAAADPGTEVLRLMAAAEDAVDFERTYWRRNETGYPFLFADQDLLNAVLGARVDHDRVEALDYKLAAPMPFGGLEVSDLEAVRCAYPDGSEPFLIHHILPAKPWLRPMYHGVFSQLLQRTLTGDDLAVRVAQREVPVWLRDSVRGHFERGRVHARDRLGWFARDHLPERLIDRLDKRRTPRG